jgi:transposase
LLLVGDDWAEDHHDVEVQDETGRRLGKARLPEGIAGIAQLHALIGRFLPEDAGPEQVVVGIETDRGGWVQALVAAGYQVFAVNPLQVARYRSGMSPREPRATLGMRTRWPTWSAATVISYARSLQTVPWLRRSRSWPAPTRG